MEIRPVCRELGIGFVAYSPLGRGFLTAKFKKAEDLPPSDWRRNSPRFQGENFERNRELVERIESLAMRKKCTAAQMALGWVLAQAAAIRHDIREPVLQARAQGFALAQVDPALQGLEHPFHRAVHSGGGGIIDKATPAPAQSAKDSPAVYYLIDDGSLHRTGGWPDVEDCTCSRQRVHSRNADSGVGCVRQFHSIEPTLSASKRLKN
jgi:hypothetical protein